MVIKLVPIYFAILSISGCSQQVTGPQASTLAASDRDLAAFFQRGQDVLRDPAQLKELRAMSLNQFYDSLAERVPTALTVRIGGVDVHNLAAKFAAERSAIRASGWGDSRFDAVVSAPWADMISSAKGLSEAQFNQSISKMVAALQAGAPSSGLSLGDEDQTPLLGRGSEASADLPSGVWMSEKDRLQRQRNLTSGAAIGVGSLPLVAGVATLVTGVAVTGTGVGAPVGVPLVVAGAYTLCAGAFALPGAVVGSIVVDTMTKGLPARKPQPIAATGSAGSGDDCKGIKYQRLSE